MRYIDRIQSAFDRLDARATHERALILFGAIAVIVLLWQTALMDSVTREQDAAARELPGLASEIAALNERVTQLQTSLRDDPDAPVRAQRAALEAERNALGERLTELTSGLVPPEEMASALRELLRREPGLELIRLEALPAERLVLAPEPEPTNAAHRPAVFKHAVVIELRGEYLAALRYVSAVEKMPWRFFWDSVDYRVEEHPVGRLQLTLYSLSLREGWLGV